MPRKAKDKIEENDVIEEKKSAAKKTSTAKKSISKKETTKKSTVKTTTKEPTKKTSSTKKSTKESAKKSTTSRKKATKKEAVKTTEQSPIQISEYYDLPYKYGRTVVRLLAQTPKTLFVYWEVSNDDIENFKKTYGDDFFIKTKPILVVHNTTLNKTTEIEINDFANCWYLNIEDSDCKYDIELARKYIENISTTEESQIGYLPIANSNDLQSPNNHILFEKIQEFVVFRDVTTDNIIKKDVNLFKFLRDIYKFYQDMYDEDILDNPSSQFKF